MKPSSAPKLKKRRIRRERERVCVPAGEFNSTSEYIAAFSKANNLAPSTFVIKNRKVKA